MQQDKFGNIIKINDGKKTPLILGSIPRNQNDIDKLKSSYNLSKQDEISIFTLNRQFECDWSGLSKLSMQDKTLNFSRYPTTDYSAPLFIDLIRAVRDLENRDDCNHGLAYVHCKAGRGRSATGVAAYLINVLHKVNINTSPKQIEAYLQLHRPQVRLNDDHNAALINFELALKKAGSFEELYTLNKNATEKRDEEILDNNNQNKSYFSNIQNMIYEKIISLKRIFN